MERQDTEEVSDDDSDEEEEDELHLPPIIAPTFRTTAASVQVTDFSRLLNIFLLT